MRMPTHHLVAYGPGDVVEGEAAGFLGHARVEDDLQQQITEFFLERRQIVGLGSFGNLIGFLDRVWRDGSKALRHVPGAPGFGVAQARHDA